MCKVVAYLVTNMMPGISVSYISFQFYCRLYIVKEFTTPDFLTTHLLASFPSSLSGYLISPTPGNALSNTKSEGHTIISHSFCHFTSHK